MLLHRFNDYFTVHDLCNAVELLFLSFVAFSPAFLMPIAKGFRRFQSNIFSYRQGDHIPAVTELSNLVRGSNIQQSGRPSAARFASTRPIRKRIKSADRRTMLESFVDKYRAMNMGKFPSPTSAQKEVGGSYYLIKKMLQEMEYNIKISCVENGVVKEIKKQAKSEDTISREVAIESSGSQKKSNIQITIDQQLSEDPWIESVSNFDSASKLQKEIKISCVENGVVKEIKKQAKSEDTINREVAIESSGSQEKSNVQVTIDQQLSEDPWIEPVSNFVSTSELEEEIKPSTSSAYAVNNNIIRDDTQNVATEIHDRKCHEKLEHQDDGIRNVTSEQQNEDEFREETSLWGNLKSIATDFINIWRKK